MVNCFDRIAVHMAELALEQVRQLAQVHMLGAVSLRTPSNGRRYTLTVAKRYPDGEQEPPKYTWDIAEIASDGEPLPDGYRASSAPGAYLENPDAAYWEAVDELAAA